MKKLMFIAAAAAMTSAFGVQVADYRAQVAYVDMVKVSGTYEGAKISVAFKYVKNATIAGYVVYSDCACNDVADADARTNPAYVVVKCSAQKIATPRIFPAELLVRMWDRSLGGSGIVESEGYLFAGLGKGAWTFDQDAAGDAKRRSLDLIDGNRRGYGVRPWANYDAYLLATADGVGTWAERDLYKFGSDKTLATLKMFGTYNDKEPTALGFKFYDAWMDHAGFGKASYSFTDGGCGEGDKGYCLQTLQGYLIGGLFICHPNAYTVKGDWDWFPCHKWEGTTDVVTGFWGMRKFTNECPAEGLAATEDGSFFTGLHAVWSKDQNRITGYELNGFVAGEDEDGKYFVNQQKASHLFPYLKSCVKALGTTGLAFIDREDGTYNTSLLLQDGSRDQWYDDNAEAADLLKPWAGTPWEHFFRCVCDNCKVEAL